MKLCNSPVDLFLDNYYSARNNSCGLIEIANNEIRAKGVTDFLNKICKHNKAQVMTITNPYGPTIDG